jgi:predicted esterase
MAGQAGGGMGGMAGTAAGTGSPSSGGMGGADAVDASAGGDDGGESSDGGDIDPPELSFTCPGGSIIAGMNELAVGGSMRTLHAAFPADTSRPMGIVFSWHGFNEDPVAYRNNLALDPDGDPEQPLVVITPDDADFEIPTGLDWQLDSGDPATNVDLAFFEAIVGCLDAQYEVDATRIYSVGFSAGSVMSSLLHSRYPELLSAIVCFSGMWFNDPQQVALINLVPVMPTWPALDPLDEGAVLLTHGGPSDVTVLGVANLEDMAQAAFPFLAAGNRVVVDCAHGQGHIPHPEINAARVSAFLSAHRAGQPSAYRSGGYEGFPASCALRLP